MIDAWDGTMHTDHKTTILLRGTSITVKVHTDTKRGPAQNLEVTLIIRREYISEGPARESKCVLISWKGLLLDYMKIFVRLQLLCLRTFGWSSTTVKVGKWSTRIQLALSIWSVLADPYCLYDSSLRGDGMLPWSLWRVLPGSYCISVSSTGKKRRYWPWVFEDWFLAPIVI